MDFKVSFKSQSFIIPYVLTSILKSLLGVHWKDWCWSWNSSTLDTWYKELTHLKRPWCWKRLRAGGERDNRGWDGWMASLTQCTWVWVDSGSWWCTGRHGVLWFMRPQRIGRDRATELSWTELNLNPEKSNYDWTVKLILSGFLYRNCCALNRYIEYLSSWSISGHFSTPFYWKSEFVLAWYNFILSYKSHLE